MNNLFESHILSLGFVIEEQLPNSNYVLYAKKHNEALWLELQVNSDYNTVDILMLKDCGDRIDRFVIAARYLVSNTKELDYLLMGSYRTCMFFGLRQPLGS